VETLKTTVILFNHCYTNTRMAMKETVAEDRDNSDAQTG
jgi:hypothetical protein